MERLLPLVLALLLLAPAALAEDAPATRRVAIPNAGLTVEVPAGWDLEQYGPSLLRVRKAQATLWFYPAEGADETSMRHLRRLADQAKGDAPDAPAPEPKRWKVPGAPGAMQLWYAEEDRARFHGIVPVEKREGFYAEADLPANAPALKKAVEGMLATVEAVAYKHPERHVDWNLGFTIDAGDEAWTVRREKDGRIRVLPGESKGVLVIEQQGKTVAAATPKARIEGLLEAMKRRLSETAGAANATLDGELEETTLGADTKAVRAPMLVTVGASLAMKGHVYVADRFVLSTAAAANDEKALAALDALARTFRLGTHPGPQAKAKSAQPTDTFTREGLPPVVFQLPEGWVIAEPRTRMHAGHLKPSADSALSIDAFYFGAGGGGGKDANLERWRGQMKADGEPKEETIQVAEGIEVTYLDIVGTYGGMRGNPHARPAEGSKSEGGQRMFAAFMSCPEGPLFFKFVGAKDDVAEVMPQVMAWIKSFRVKR
ncbi:MAG: hypothetical protein QNJ98_04490 [Planctomycetota bacterium]|nr:hypothetical protein [Planctomycetota bacterium]